MFLALFKAISKFRLILQILNQMNQQLLQAIIIDLEIFIGNAIFCCVAFFMVQLYAKICSKIYEQFRICYK